MSTGKRRLIVKEDFNIGYGATTIPADSGGTRDANKVGLHTWNGVFNVKHLGAIGDGVADDTAAIIAALAEIGSGGGTVLLPAGVYRVSSDISVQSGASFVSDGLATLKAIGGGTFTRALLICGEYVAGGAAFPYGGAGNRHGVLENIYIDGNNIAPIGLYIGGAVQRFFRNIDIQGCTAQGLVIDGAQNCGYYNIHSEKNGSNPAGTYDCQLLIDRGAGNNSFYNTELSADTAGTQGKYNLVIRQSGASPTGAFTAPRSNRFFGGVIERSTGHTAGIYMRAGVANQFYGMDMQSSAAALVKCDNGDATVQLPEFVACSFVGSTNIAFDLDGTYKLKLVDPFFETFTTLFDLSSTATVILSGDLHAGGVTTMVSAGSISDQITRPAVQLHRAISSVSTAANTIETTLHTYTMPAQTCWREGNGVRYIVQGYFGANANSKTLRFYVGANEMAGAPVSVENGAAWRYEITLLMDSATTWRWTTIGYIGASIITNTWGAGQTADPGAAIIIKATGQNGTASAGDITMNLASVELIA